MEAFPDAPTELPLQSSDEKTVAPPSNDTTPANTMAWPGSGRALFSTELGTRPQRDLRGPPFPPVIVRGDKVAGVVQTALHWRKKFPQICWTVFPQCGWMVEDFWDAEDIHVDTREHLTEVLTFLSRDNLWCASRFAEDWSRANTEQVAKILGVGDLKGSYDPKDHLAIVDKLFVNGETADKPREFLWHVAHIMRTALVEVREKQQCEVSTNDPQQLASIEHHHGAPTQSSPTEASLEKLNIANASSAQPGDPYAKAPRSSSTTVPTTSAPYVPPSAPSQHGSLPTAKRVPSHGPPPPGAYHGQPMGHIMGGMQGQVLAPPNMSIPELRNPKGRPGPGGPYNQPVPPGAYGDNLPRGPSGAYSSRPPSGAMSGIRSPHFNPASMVMGQPVMGPQHPMQPYGQGYPQMSPSSYPAHLHHPDLAHLGMMYPPAHMPGISMPPGYVNQPFHGQRPRGMSISDTTNNQYYSSSIPPHDPTSRRSSRQSGLHSGGNNALYDPYGGSKPAFNDPHAGGKTSRGGGFMEQPGKSRKPSFAGHQPRTASHGNELVEQAPGNGGRYRNMIEDPSIVNDRVRGCDRTWIGPENQIVNELFVSDLPDDVQPDELRSVFAREININPVKITIKQSPHGYHPHAFVLFSTSSDARVGLRVSDADPKIRGSSIRITVPRRFYQKNDDYRYPHDVYQPASKQVEERGIRSVTRMASHEEEAVPSKEDVQSAHLYSPQDARSDLQKRSSPEALSLDHPVESNSVTPKTETARSTAQHEEAIEEEREVKDTAKSALVPKSKSATEDHPAEMTMESDATSSHEEAISPVSTPTDGVDDVPAQIAADFSTNDGTVATIEETLMQPSPLDESLTTGHDRVESQTKAVLEGTDALAAIVRLPESDKAVEPRLMEAKRKETTEPEPSSAPASETESESEQGPDSSFLSAQELVATTEPTLVPNPEPRATNEGTDATMTSASVEVSTHPPLPKTPENSQELILSEPTVANQDTAAPVSAPATNTEDTQALTVPPDDMKSAATPPQPLVAVAKKIGPQQTASINPFGITKAQRQKEREQKKKDKKREQEEKTAKAKTEKADKTGVSSSKAASVIKNSSQVRVGSIDPFLSSSPNHPPTATTNTADSTKTPSTNEKSKGKVKLKVSPTGPSGQVSTVGGKEEIPGKQNGGTTTEVPNAVTHKVKVAPKGAKSPTEEESSVAEALLSLAQSPDHSVVVVSDRSAEIELHPGPLAKDSVNANDALTVPAVPKVKKLVPAVPEFNLHFDPNRSTITQPGTNSAKLSSSSSGASPTVEDSGKFVSCTDENQPLTVQKVMSPPRESDTLSVASSDTLHHNESAQLSPSPTADEFSTPLQTPAMPSTSEEQAQKQNKKKNKKKKKKKTAAVSDAPTPATATVSATYVPTGSVPFALIGSTAYVPTGASSSAGPSVPKTATFVDGAGNWNGDPFGGQLSHIDAIRAKANSPDNFFNRLAREKAEKDTKPPTKTTDDYRMVQAWMIENPSAWKKDFGKDQE